jgi:hypothetical protein
MLWDVPRSDSRTIASAVYQFPRWGSRTCGGSIGPPKQRARSNVRLSGLQSRLRQTTRLEDPQNTPRVDTFIDDRKSVGRLLSLRHNSQKITLIWDPTGVNCTFMYRLLLHTFSHLLNIPLPIHFFYTLLISRTWLLWTPFTEIPTNI